MRSGATIVALCLRRAACDIRWLAWPGLPGQAGMARLAWPGWPVQNNAKLIATTAPGLRRSQAVAWARIAAADDEWLYARGASQGADIKQAG